MAAMPPSSGKGRLGFGVFELDLETGELHKSGHKIPLRPQAARVLTLLAIQSNHLITREELKDQIWGRDTFVDFEHGLNLCIRQIRAALGDDADTPRYIETLPRRGYRFIAPITHNVHGHALVAAGSTNASAEEAKVESPRRLGVEARQTIAAESFETVTTHEPERRLQEITENGEEKGAPRRQTSTRSQKSPGMALAVLLTTLALLTIGWFIHRHNSYSDTSSTEWTAVTNFPDSATSPGLSKDGRMLTFIRGPSTFIGQGEIYVKLLPDGDPIQLTHDGLAKMSPVFSPDGSRVAYTIPLRWDTWSVPVLSGPPTLMLPNASGLSWIDTQHLLFSEIKSGIHMALVTAAENRSGERDIYIPRYERGMVHRSAISPDGKFILLAEMENNGWLPCRVVSVSNLADTRVIGPAGRCTSAAWSPDGKWMYFSADLGMGFHIWRQRFPESQPEQVTRGPNQEEGIAIAPDGRSLLTSVGIEERSLWVHDSQGDRRISAEGSASNPWFSADGRRVFYIAHPHGGSDFPGQGELYAAELESNQSERLLPGFPIFDYAISPNGKQAIVSSPGTDGVPHLWLASLDRRFSPRQLTSSAGEDRPFFASAGDIFFRQKDEHTSFLYRMKQDGTQKQRASAHPISELIDVSPDGNWALTYAAVPDKDVPYATVALPVGKSDPPVRICQMGCIAGWSRDGKTFYVEIRNAAKEKQAGKTLVFSLRARPSLLPLLPRSGIDFDNLEGLQSVQILPYVIAPGPDPSIYAFSQKSVHRNIYRVPIP